MWSHPFASSKKKMAKILPTTRSQAWSTFHCFLGSIVRAILRLGFQTTAVWGASLQGEVSPFNLLLVIKLPRHTISPISTLLIRC